MKQDKNFLGFAHVGIFTNKYEETVDFYTKILPFEVVKVLREEQPEPHGPLYPMDCTMVRLNDLFIEIMKGADGRNADGVLGVYNHIGISVANIEEAVERLRANGLPDDRIGEIKFNDTFNPPHTQKICCIYGPIGDKISLYELTNKEFYDLED